MEDSEQKIIRSRLSDLVIHTKCSVELLSFLYEKEIFAVGDLERIATKPGDIDKAVELYNIIPSRTNGFALLLEGLRITRQSKVLEILTGKVPENVQLTKEEVELGVTKLSKTEIEGRVKNLLREESQSVKSLVWKYLESFAVVGFAFLFLVIYAMCSHGYVPFDRISTTQKLPHTIANQSFDVAPPVELFTGRKQELDDLHKKVFRSSATDTSSMLSQMTVISGLGGIGKTQLARQYVTTKGLIDFNGNCIWLNAESEASLRESFQRLSSEKLLISTKDIYGNEKSIKSVVEGVYNYFQGGRVLFVLDNAERRSWLRKFLPVSSLNSNVYIILTSRERQWEKGMEILDLREFSVEDCAEIVIQGLELELGLNEKVNKSVKELSQRLQCYPLALQQAISYIHEQQIIMSNYSIHDYLIDFDKIQVELLSYYDSDSIVTDYTKTTFTTWKITTDKIALDPDYGALALVLLRVMGYLSPNNIQKDLFYKPTLIKGLDQTKVNFALKLLNKYSIINEGAHKGSLSIHRLVQEVTRITLNRYSNKGEYNFQNLLAESRHDFLAKQIENPLVGTPAMHLMMREDLSVELIQKSSEMCFLGLVIMLLDEDINDEFPLQNIEHALIAWKHALEHAPLIRVISKKIFRILVKMNEVGMNEKGILFAFEASKKVKQYLGDNNEQWIKIQILIAKFLRSQGDMIGSYNILKNILNKTNSSLCFWRNDSLLTTYVKHALLVTENQLIYCKEFAHLQRYVKENGFVFLGDDNHEIILDALNGAEEYLDVCQFAIKINSILASVYKTVYHIDHVAILEIYHHIADLNYQLENYEESLKLWKEIFQKLNSNSKSKTREISLAVEMGLGKTLFAIGEFHEAQKIFENNYETTKTLFGETHLFTLTVLEKIGDIFRSKGEYQKALEKHRKVYQGLASLFGEKDLKTFTAKIDIGKDLLYLREYEQCRVLVEELYYESSFPITFHVPQTPLEGNEVVGRTLNFLLERAEFLKEAKEFVSLEFKGSSIFNVWFNGGFLGFYGSRFLLPRV